MKKNIIISVQFVALAICVYFIFNASGAPYNPKFLEPAPNSTATDGIQAYRNMWSGSIYKKTKVITYHPDDIIKYINGPYRDLTSKITLLPGYHWVVGFYLKREDNQAGDPRNAFYVVPTMQKNDNSDIHDYYDHLTEYRDNTSTPLPNQMSAYNAGHIWP